jgi:hypothetical protein
MTAKQATIKQPLLSNGSANNRPLSQQQVNFWSGAYCAVRDEVLHVKVSSNLIQSSSVHGPELIVDIWNKCCGTREMELRVSVPVARGQFGGTPAIGRRKPLPSNGSEDVTAYTGV